MTNETPRYGAVTNASCALASLHNKSMRVALGLDRPDMGVQFSTALQFYNRSYYQLLETKSIAGGYSELDAIAALQLVSYFLLSGGSGHWVELLDIAREWLSTMGIATHENPRMVLMEMNDVAKLATKLTMVSTFDAPVFVLVW